MVAVLDASASRASLRRLWKAGRGSLPIVLDPRMTAKQLESFALAHSGERYARALFQILANHPKASGRFFRLLLAQSGGAPEIASAIIQSGRAPKSLLRAFRKSPSRSVKEHADLALLGAAMDSGSRDTFARLLDRHWGKDTGISLGVRQMMAAHPQTPRRLLKRLAGDEADFIAALARKRLAGTSRPSRQKVSRSMPATP